MLSLSDDQKGGAANEEEAVNEVGGEDAVDDSPAGDTNTNEPQTRTMLKYYHTLGFSYGSMDGQQSRNVLSHISDNSFVYLAGKHVAVYSYENQGAHRFILKNPKTSRIMAFSVSANRRYIALSEVLHPEPSGGIQVSVYNFSTASKVRELGRGRFPSSAEGSQPPVTALDFSRDNKYLVTVTDPPNPYIYLWQLDKQRLAGMSEIHQKISQVSISPWAHWELCGTGTSMLRLWRAQGNQLKCFNPLTPPADGEGESQSKGIELKDHCFTCHSWYDCDRLVSGTNDGDILVIENQEVKRVISSAHGKKRSVTCISSVSRGFIAGGEDAVISIYERTYDSQFFNCFKVIRTPEKLVGSPYPCIVDCSINPNEEVAVFCLDNNEVIQLELNNIEGDAETEQKDSNSKSNTNTTITCDGSKQQSKVFKKIPIGFHKDTVTGVDVCVQRSIVVTSSTDKHIRVWNFLKKTVEISKKFDEEVLSIAIHPSGYTLVAGFRFKLCVFLVLANDLQPCHEFTNIKQCREIRFSHGGQYFAAVGNPWSRIALFNSYTFLPLSSRENPSGAPLTGHSASVQSICWSQNDQHLISAGSDGAIYHWVVSTGKRLEQNESVLKYVNYQCIRYDDDSQTLATIAVHRPATDSGYKEEKPGPSKQSNTDSEVTLRTLRFQLEYPPKAPQRVMQNPITISSQGIQQHPSPAVVAGNNNQNSTSTDQNNNRFYSKTTPQAGGRQPRSLRSSQLAISPLAQTLFVATSTGQILLYEWPPSDGAQPYTKMEVHAGEILFILLSLDEKYLFTVGSEDRCLFTFEVDTVAEGRPITRKPFPYSSFEHVAYFSQHEYDEKGRYIAELIHNNEDITRRQHAEILRLQEDSQIELRKVEEETASELKSMRHAMEIALRDKSDVKQEANATCQSLTDQHMKAAEELEAMHTRHIEELEKRQQVLEDEQDDITVRYENKLHRMQAEVEGEQRQLELQHRDLKQKLSQDIEHQHKELREHTKAVNDMVNTTIHDYLLELEGGPAVEGIHDQWKSHLAAKTNQLSQTRTNTALFKTRREKHARDIFELESQIESKKEEESLLTAKSQDFLKTNEALRAEINQRNDTISASERKILELKKQTAELDKLRYVLSFKFIELRKEVAPKEEQIKELHETIHDMDQSLESAGIERDRLHQSMYEKDGRIQQLMQSLSYHNNKLDDKQRATQQLLRELTSLVSTMDTTTLRQDIQLLVDAYVVKYEEEVGASQEKDRADEFQRQKQYMSAKLTSVGVDSRKNEIYLRKDNQSKTEENVVLVREINLMRVEKKMLSQRWQQSDSQLKELQALLRNGSSPAGKKASRPFSAPVVGVGNQSVRTAPSVKSKPAFPATSSSATNTKGLKGRTHPKGKILKGTTRSLRDLSDMNPQKLAEIVNQVEQTNTCIRRQASEITLLKGYLKELLENDPTKEGNILPTLNT